MVLKRTAQAAIATLLTFGVSASGGCSALLELDELPRGKPFTYADAFCEACVAQSCEAEEAACANNAACTALYACLAQTPRDDPAARYDCQKQHALGVNSPPAVALDVCRREQCLDECIGVGGFLRDTYGEACSSCLAEQCREDLRACVAQRACDIVMPCWESDPHFDRILFCLYEEAADSDEANLAEDCFRGCLDCRIGRKWGCVEEFSWGSPPTDGASIPTRFSVGELLAGNPAPGITVDVCSPEPVSCQKGGVTNEQGIAEFDLPNDKLRGGFTGYLRLAQGEVHGEPIYPELFFFGRPIYRAETRVGTRVVAQSLLEPFVPGGLVDGLGHLSVKIWDCPFQEAPGISIDVNDEAKSDALYIRYDDPAIQVAGKAAAAVLANLHPGCIEVTAKLEGNVVSRQRVRVEPNTLTTLFMGPMDSSHTSGFLCALPSE